MNAQTDAAREDARETTGQFGTQVHTEAGVVDAPTGPSPEDVEAVLHAMEWVNMDGSTDDDDDDDDDDTVALDDFGGLYGDTFEVEVEQVAAGIMSTEGDNDPRPLQLTVVADAGGGPSMIQVGAYDRKTGLSHVYWENWGDLTADRNATGRDAARALASELLSLRDRSRETLAKYIRIPDGE